MSPAAEAWRKFERLILKLTNPFKPVSTNDASVTDPLSRSVAEAAWLGVLGIGVAIFLISQYLPVSGKVQNNIAYSLILLPTLFLLWMERALFARHLVSARLLLLFFVAVLASDLMLAEGDFIKSLAYTALFCGGIYLLALLRPASLTFAYAVFALASLVTLLSGFIGWSGGSTQSELFSRQVGFGSAENPIYAGLLVVSGCAFLAYSSGGGCVQSPRIKQAMLMLLYLTVALLGTIVFQSRSALLGLIISTLFYGWVIGRQRLIITGFVLIGIVLLVSGTYQAVIVRGLSYRPEIWMDVVQTWYSSCSMLFGCGKTEEVFLGQFFGSHSGYFGTLFRHGPLALVALLTFACWYLYKGLASRSRWFLVSLVGWGGMLTAMDGFVGSPSAWWVFVWVPTVAAIADFERLAGRPQPLPAQGGDHEPL